MKALVVTAHPIADSLCRQLGALAVEKLTAAGHEVKVENLYDNHFQAALSASERASYYDDKFDDSALTQEISRLQEAQILVLVFPTWWFGFPAILKGWFDRVWAPGVAFDHGENFGPIKPRLTQLEHVVAITSLGSPWWVDWLVMRRPVRKIIARALLGACAQQAKLTFLSVYNSEKLDQTGVDRFKAKVAARLERL